MERDYVAEMKKIWEPSVGEKQKVDPRDPDPSREGIFRDHNCSYCNNGKMLCKQGSYTLCEHPHARND